MTARVSPIEAAVVDLFRAQVPEDDYPVGLVRVLSGRKYRSRKLSYLACRIVDGPHAGVLLPRVVNELHKGSRSNKSNLATDFRQIIELVPPAHLSKIPLPDIYGNCVLLARVEFVKENAAHDEIPEGARTSIIRAFIKRIAGTPPYLARRES